MPREASEGRSPKRAFYFARKKGLDPSRPSALRDGREAEAF
jgi:hypothetical protein